MSKGYVICMLAADVSKDSEYILAIIGAVKDTCPDCGKLIWRSPSSLIQESQGHEMVCTSCVFTKQAVVRIEPPSPEQEADIAYFFKSIAEKE